MALDNRLKAAQSGRKHYHGPACNKGHGTMRYTSSGRCITCTAETSAARNKHIRETLKENSC